MPPLVFAPGQEVFTGDTEYTMLPFFYDPDPIPGDRYDACVGASACPARDLPQPPGAPAVGMSWNAAQTFCETRGMRVQSAPQDAAIGRRGDREPHLQGADPNKLVVYGFRCTLAADACQPKPTDP